jgi:hypothetical protein
MSCGQFALPLPNRSSGNHCFTSTSTQGHDSRDAELSKRRSPLVLLISSASALAVGGWLGHGSLFLIRYSPMAVPTTLAPVQQVIMVTAGLEQVPTDRL